MSCKIEEAIKILDDLVKNASANGTSKEGVHRVEELRKTLIGYGEKGQSPAKEQEKVLTEDGTINIYSNDKNGYEELSNLAVRPFVFKGKQFQSVEHAYQSLKSGTGLEEKVYSKDWSKGGLVQRGTKGTKTEGNWNTDTLMPMLMKASFEQNPDAAELLVSTGDSKLTHNVKDAVWKNKFPEILERLRHEYKNKAMTDGPQHKAPTETPMSDLNNKAEAKTKLDTIQNIMGDDIDPNDINRILCDK